MLKGFRKVNFFDFEDTLSMASKNLILNRFDKNRYVSKLHHVSVNYRIKICVVKHGTILSTTLLKWLDFSDISSSTGRDLSNVNRLNIKQIWSLSAALDQLSKSLIKLKQNLSLQSDCIQSVIHYIFALLIVILLIYLILINRLENLLLIVQRTRSAKKLLLESSYVQSFLLDQMVEVFDLFDSQIELQKVFQICSTLVTFPNLFSIVDNLLEFSQNELPNLQILIVHFLILQLIISCPFVEQISPDFFGAAVFMDRGA